MFTKVYLILIFVGNSGMMTSQTIPSYFPSEMACTVAGAKAIDDYVKSEINLAGRGTFVCVTADE